jgi:GNAT superfamily N-acetyltransferase
MTNPVTLRIATTADIPAMETLIRRSGIELSKGFYSDEQAAAVTRHVFGVDSQLLEDGTYFVIERDSVLLACGGWSKRATLFGGDRHKSGPDPLLDPATQAARIRAFFVDPTVPRQGLGRMLMQFCEQEARSAGFRAMELAATMPGVPLYRACGFEPIEDMQLALPDNVTVPLSRMRKQIT